MIVRTYFDRNNTIVYNSKVNTGKNPITELFYGTDGISQSYSRFLFQFDETRLKDFYTGGTFPDLTKLTHTLNLTNTGSFDKDLLGAKTNSGKARACSFDLILFEINEDWDEGCGYDYDDCITIGENAQSFSPSNWLYARTNTPWPGGPGVYSGSVTELATQHFEDGNENLKIDITDIVNGYLTGNTNNGLGIAYKRSLEETKTEGLQYVGFFTRHTQTFYEPVVESRYETYINDDRVDFYLDKPNKLYLYSNLAGNPTNLDTIPGVVIRDNNDEVYATYSPSDVNHVTKGIYSIDISIPTTTNSIDCMQFTDTWTDVIINGVNRPDIELDFILKDSSGYYNIGDNDMLPKQFGLTISGIKRDETVFRGDIRKVIVSANIPYTISQKQVLDKLQYRLYVKEGVNELTVTDYDNIEMTSNSNYFLLDTLSLIPGIYYLDIKVESNLEVTTTKETLKFEVVSESNLRISQ